MKEVDFLIVGQGLCGTLLSRQLLKEGKTVTVIDDSFPMSSSKVAGGIINPVTGKRLVNSWMIEELLPVAWATYSDLGQELGELIIQQCCILDFHATQDMKDIFTERQSEGNKYLTSDTDNEAWEKYFRFNYDLGKIAPCMLLDIRAMLLGWSFKLQAAGILLEESFDLKSCIITDNDVSYKNIRADKLLFCDGAAAAQNPYFDRLPWSKDKGEALIVSIPGLPDNRIYKQGSISIVPWHNGLFWVGAAHDWKFTDMLPSFSFRKRVEEQLDYWLKLPYAIVDHLTALRPANVDRKPFVGLHPLHPSVGIFNGMGGKGCSLAPYFANQFTQYLIHHIAIMPDVDIKRYSRILSR